MDELIKPVSVGLLFVFLAVCDFLKINDPMLRDAAFGMIGTITTWHGMKSLPISFSKGVPTTTVTVQASAQPAAPVQQ
ncbi:hypothetical protein [Paraburkholderia sediminicola]|uniref:hypothetical protein n=1 Tax=Paraburkholderia sediminicola TaxID=458836 RepID=UPI0038BB6E38